MKVSLRKSGMLIMVMLVVALLLAACSGNNNGNGETVPVATPGNDAVETPPPPPPADDDATVAHVEYETSTRSGIHEPRDMGGRTLMIASDWGNAMPFSRLGYEEPDPATAGNYFIDRLIWDNAQRVYREFNFVLDYVTIAEDLTSVFTASVMAGDPIGDLVFLSGGQQLSAIVGDLIMPLTVANLPNSDVLGAQIYGRVSNHAFGQPWSLYYSSLSPHIFMMGVNLDIINAIGAPNPVDLFNQGRWTWEAALDIMRMATRDTTGDGTFDQWGIAGQPGDLMNHFIAANDGIFVDDNLQYAFDHPNTIEALEFMETIFHEGLWQYDPVMGADPTDWGRNFFAFHEGNAALFKSIFWGMNGGDLPFEFAVVPFPTGPSNTTGSTWGSGWDGGLTFPHGSSWDPADLLMIAEEFLAWPGPYVELIVEGGLTTARETFRTEEDVQRWAANSHNVRRDIGHVVPEFNWVSGDFAGYFISREMNVMQAIEAYRAPQQELLDLFFR